MSSGRRNDCDESEENQSPWLCRRPWRSVLGEGGTQEGMGGKGLGPGSPKKCYRKRAVEK